MKIETPKNLLKVFISRTFSCGNFDSLFKFINFEFLNAFKIEKFYKFLKQISKLSQVKVLLINTFNKFFGLLIFILYALLYPEKCSI